MFRVVRCWRSPMLEEGDKGRGWVFAIVTFWFLKGFLLVAFVIGAFMLLAGGVGALFYAALFFVEVYGLFCGRMWAEWLIVFAMVTFISFEIYELVKDVTATRIVALVLNALIVAYLVWRRVKHHASEK